MKEERVESGCAFPILGYKNFIEVWAVVGIVFTILGAIIGSAAGLGYIPFKTKSPPPPPIRVVPSY